ncbi:hypothetical protein [Pseudovibrio sp. POLY-S9]|uniref:hypothetical protein n=1 Tax=Pseudovibrio sp. POLY-S9 TaxID=1576596 RepID=UPI000B096F24|nr:hypothetical protein [Pseudovibrio sp. POLY-S9]
MKKILASGRRGIDNLCSLLRRMLDLFKNGGRFDRSLVLNGFSIAIAVVSLVVAVVAIYAGATGPRLRVTLLHPEFSVQKKMGACEGIFAIPVVISYDGDRQGVLQRFWRVASSPIGFQFISNEGKLPEANLDLWFDDRSFGDNISSGIEFRNLESPGYVDMQKLYAKQFDGVVVDAGAVEVRYVLGEFSLQNLKQKDEIFLGYGIGVSFSNGAFYTQDNEVLPVTGKLLDCV